VVALHRDGHSYRRIGRNLGVSKDGDRQTECQRERKSARRLQWATNLVTS